MKIKPNFSMLLNSVAVAADLFSDREARQDLLCFDVLLRTASDLAKVHHQYETLTLEACVLRLPLCQIVGTSTALREAVPLAPQARRKEIGAVSAFFDQVLFDFTQTMRAIKAAA